MFRKSSSQNSAPSAAPSQSTWDSDDDLEAYMARASTPGPSTSNANQLVGDSDSDSSFDRFLLEERMARENGVRKRAVRKKKQASGGKRVSTSRSAHTSTSSDEVPSSSENEFDTFIRRLGSLPPAEAEQSGVAAPATKRRAKTKTFHASRTSTPATASTPADPSPLPSVRPRTARPQNRRNVRSSHLPSRGIPTSPPSEQTGHTGRVFSRRHSPTRRRSAARASAAAASAAAAVVIELSGDEDDLNLSPHTISNHQLAEDEVYARNLQEQMDREYASHLANSRTPESHRHSVSPPAALAEPVPFATAEVTDPVSSITNPASLRRRRGANRGSRSGLNQNSPGRLAPPGFNFHHELANALVRRSSIPTNTRLQVSGYPHSAWHARGRHQMASSPVARYEDLIRLQEELGDVASRGMSDAQLEMLPTKVLNLNPGDPVTECPICCEDYAKKDLIKILTCFHEFHDHCIRAWLKNNKTCPICRVEIKLE